MNNLIKGAAVVALSCAATQTLSAKKMQQPNIVFLLIDDLGAMDLGCYGNRMSETPAINQLAQQSMRFTQAYASPVSSPTRTSIISGQNSARHGVWEVIGCHDRPYARMQSPEFKEEIPEEIETYADILTGVGYDCAIFGKWHAGRTPEKEGFGGCNVEIKDPELKKHAKENDIKQTGTITAKSIEFMRANVEQKKPFVLCVSHNLVHAPLEATKAMTDKYHAKMRKTGVIDMHPQYLSMLEMVDESVDMVLSELDKLGIADNTVVFLYGDNGALVSDMMLVTPLASSTAPLRDQKGCLYEGGIRVPLIVRWPGKIEAGSESDAPMMTYDLFSTFLEIGSGKVPAGQITDGESLIPVLTQKADKLKREAIYWHFPTNMWTRHPEGAIRKGDYKLIENYLDGSIQLYNVVADIGETTDLASTNPELAKDLLEDLRAWRKDVGAGMPTPNPNYDPLRENEMAKDWW
ncbi:MAG: sulfatase [Rikenellaceae bacterium]